MPIPFNSIPSSARTPFVFVEFDSSRAVQVPGAVQFAGLLIGQRLSTGTVAALVPTVVTREEQAIAFFGAGSMIQDMARAFFAQRAGAELTVVALADPAGDKGAGTVVFGASSPQPGNAVIWVGGRRYSVPSSTVSTASTLAAALAAAISADPYAAVTAAASTATVTVTARHAGTAAGLIDIRHSHAADEALPVGVTAAITAMSGGTGDVDLDDVIAAIPADKQFHVMALPYTDSTNLGKLKTELDDRLGPERQIGSVAFVATTGNLSAAQTLGNAHNSASLCVMSVYSSPSPVWAIASAAASTAAGAAAIDPARPFQTLPLIGIVAPKAVDRFSRSERDILLTDGIATTVVNGNSQVAIDRLITNYQTSALGAADTAYLDATTVFTLDRLRFELRTLFLTQTPRHKLANDGTRFAAGQAVLTPKGARGLVLGLAQSWEARGLIENLEAFKADLIAERNSLDPNRLDIYLPPDLVNGLVVVAAQLGFRL